MSEIHTNPDNVLRYRISPYTATGIFNGCGLKGKSGSTIDVAGNYFRKRFGNNICYTTTGREAISIALRSYHLEPSDLVTIITTSQNFYISGCVTKEIEKICQWNRVIVPQTKVLLVNHEFGHIYPDMDVLVALGLPIIEDCCTTFFSQNTAGRVGTYGDFSTYSFSKFFPVPMGGLLIDNRNTPCSHVSAIDAETKANLTEVLNREIPDLAKLLTKRKKIFEYGIERFRQLGFEERFKQDKLTVPVAMMIRNKGIIRDLPALKTELWRHGIEASVFYGEDAFFVPSHQNLTEADVDYFFQIIQSFIQKAL